jgi:hypothetical protein
MLSGFGPAFLWDFILQTPQVLFLGIVYNEMLATITKIRAMPLFYILKTK